MRAAIVNSAGTVENVILVESLDFIPGLQEVGDHIAIGMNVDTPAPPIVVMRKVPQSVSMRQTRLALLAAGLLDDVEAAMATQPRAAQIEWEFATEVLRSSPLVAGLSGAIRLTEAQLDDLFILAATK
jgi:hypothetical protein